MVKFLFIHSTAIVTGGRAEKQRIGVTGLVSGSGSIFWNRQTFSLDELTISARVM